MDDRTTFALKVLRATDSGSDLEVRAKIGLPVIGWFDDLQALKMLRFANGYQQLNTENQQPVVEPIDFPPHKTEEQKFLYQSYKLVDAITSSAVTSANLAVMDCTDRLLIDLQNHCDTLHEQYVDNHRKQLDNLFGIYQVSDERSTSDRDMMPSAFAIDKHRKTTDNHRAIRLLKTIAKDPSLCIGKKNLLLLQRTAALPQVILRYQQALSFSDTATKREDIIQGLKPVSTAIKKLINSPACDDQCKSSLENLEQIIERVRSNTAVLGSWRRPEQQRSAVVRATVLECVLFYRVMKPESTERFTRYERIADDEYVDGRADDEHAGVLKQSPLVAFCTLVVERLKVTPEWQQAFPDADTIVTDHELTSGITSAHDILISMSLANRNYTDMRNEAFGRSND